MVLGHHTLVSDKPKNHKNNLTIETPGNTGFLEMPTQRHLDDNNGLPEIGSP